MRHISRSSNGAGSSSIRRRVNLCRGPLEQSEDQQNALVNSNIEEVPHQLADDEEWFERGPSLLPPLPREEDKVVLTPLGDTQWREDFSDSSRVPNGILGLLIRSCYPGIVKYKGKEVPACNWRHYNVVPESASSGGQPISALQQVEEKFWQYFKWANGTKVEAKRVVRNVIKNLIPQAIYEARIWSITSYHRKVLKVSISRSEACRKYHTLEQYMRRKPWWFQKVPEAWRKQAEIWCSEDWKSHSRTGRACKDKMERGAHRQGSASLARYRKILEKREQRPVSEIEAYAMGRMDEQHGTYRNQRTADSIAAYFKAIKEKHGEDYDWQNAAIDGEVVYKAGKGKRHGRYLIGNGMISTTTLMSKMQSSIDDSLNGSGPSKRLRLDTGSTSIEQIQSEMQEMRESWEHELQLERESRERELQLERNAWEQQLQEERTARQKEHEARMQEQKEHKEERAYFDNVISAIQQQLHLNLPPRPVPVHLSN